MSVEKDSDDLWLGVKGQSNWEIAGSPRKIFRYRLAMNTSGGRALDGLGGLTVLPNPTKLRIPESNVAGVTRRVLTSVVERETTRTYS